MIKPTTPRPLRLWFAFALAGLVAGCGGGGGSGTAVAPGGPAPTGPLPVSARIRVPAAPTGPVQVGAVRRARYVSVASRSVSIAVNGGAPVVAALQAGAPGCTADPGGLSCTIGLSAPPGDDVFETRLYDGPAAGGNLLAHAALPQRIVPGASNTIDLTLHGVVASVALTLAGAPVPARGTRATIPLIVVARDAAGAIIVGDPYDTPLTLTDSDAGGATALSAPTVTAPTDAVSLTYTGAALRSAVIGVAGLPQGAVTTARLTPHTGSATDWATWGFDAQRSGENPAETSLSPANAGALAQRWSFATAGTYVNAQPVVAADVYVPTLAGGAYADVVLAADEHGDVYALDAFDGTLLWQRTLGATTTTCKDIPDGRFGITGTPALDRARNRAYVVDGTDLLHALDLSTGAEAAGWPAGGAQLGLAPAVDHVYSAPLFDAAKDRIVVVSAGYCDAGYYHGTVVTVRGSDGTPATAPFQPVTNASNWGGGIWGWGGAALDPRGGNLYVTTGNALAPENDTGSDSVLRLDESTLAQLAADRPPSGDMDLDFGAGPAIVTAPGCPPALAVQRKNGLLSLYGLDTIAAGPLQTLALGTSTQEGFNLATPAYSQRTGLLYVTLGSDAPALGLRAGLAALSVGGCRLAVQWSQPFGDPGTRAQSVVANGVVYTADGVGKTLRAFDATSGAPLAAIPLGGLSFTTPSVANGHVYTAGWNGRVSAFGVPGGP